MKFKFKALPRARVLRPVVPISFPTLPHREIPALVDSGALGTRIHAEYAELLELDLSEVEPTSLSVGLGTYECREAWVALTVRNDTRLCRVTFVEGWNHDHALLGLRGFFENYVVRIDTQNQVTELRPHRHPKSAKSAG